MRALVLSWSSGGDVVAVTLGLFTKMIALKLPVYVIVVAVERVIVYVENRNS